MDAADESQKPKPVDHQRLERIARDLKKRLGLTLFGVDVIIDKRDGEYAVIDINAFPGKNASKCLIFDAMVLFAKMHSR